MCTLSTHVWTKDKLTWQQQNSLQHLSIALKYESTEEHKEF